MTEERWDRTSGDVGRVLILTSAKRSLPAFCGPPASLLGGATENGTRVGAVSATSFFLISSTVSSHSSSHLTDAELEDDQDIPDAVDGGRSEEELEMADEGW